MYVCIHVSILLAVIDNTAVNQSQVTVDRVSLETANVTLTCTTQANPLPRLTWTVNDVPSSNGVQAVTGFMETASSTLTLSVGDLNLGENMVTCTASVDSVDVQADSAVVTVQGKCNCVLPLCE